MPEPHDIEVAIQVAGERHERPPIVVPVAVEHPIERVLHRFLDGLREQNDDGGRENRDQPVLALGSGGILGKGIARGTQKFFYLPAEHTDYIFATIGEEFGLLGTAALLLGFVVLIARGLAIARRTQEWFGSLLAAGMTCMLGLQALLNVAVVTGTVPATGVPLPFISYGGSSLLFTAIAVGIVLNVSQHPRGPRPDLDQPGQAVVLSQPRP